MASKIKGLKKRTVGEKSAAEKCYESIASAMLKRRGVTHPTKTRKGFGSSALWIADRKMFAFLSSREEFTVKLPREKVDALVASGGGRRMDPGRGRPMKEWIGLNFDSNWEDLAEESMNYVSGL